MKDREAILLEIMHLMAAKFKDRIVLEGGMLLRLLNSHRSTRDIDYVLISEESKKTLAGKIKKVLGEMEDIEIEDIKLNSRGIFIDLKSLEPPHAKLFLEISVLPSLNIPPEHISTVALSNKYSLAGRVISTMALPEAFSHKIAAALERDSIRDLYDISIFEPLSEFDSKTLRVRLDQLSVYRKKPKKVSFSEAAEMLMAKADKLNQAAIEKELRPLLPADQVKGIEIIMKAAIIRLAQKMKTQ